MNTERKNKSAKLKIHSRIYNPIKLKEKKNIQNIKNSSFFLNPKKRAKITKLVKKFKSKDLKKHILSLSFLLSDYTKNTNNNLKLINGLKEENDLLISKLNNNLQKSSFFNKTTKETFQDLVTHYENKGYKIPNFTKNVFKRIPLIMENKKDVDMYYKEDPSTKGEFIKDMNNFKEKNWTYLNKVNKDCKEAKSYFSLKNYNMYSSHDLYFDQHEIKNDQKKTKKEIRSLLSDIKKLKKTIENEEKENLILSYETKYIQNLNNQRKFPQPIKVSNNLNKFIYKRNNNDIYDNNISEMKNSKKMVIKLKKPFLSFNKTNNNSKFDLLTFTELKKKNVSNNNISHSNKKDYQIKRIKIPGSERLNKEIKIFIEKYKEKNKNEILKESNADLLEKIDGLQTKIRKSKCIKFHKDQFYYTKKYHSRIKYIEEIENKIFDLDKNYIRQSVAKSFED